MQQEPVNKIPGILDDSNLTTKEEVDLMKSIDEYIEIKTELKTKPKFKSLNIIFATVTMLSLTLALILTLDKRDYDKCQELGVLSGQRTQWLSVSSLCVNEKGGIVKRKESTVTKKEPK